MAYTPTPTYDTYSSKRFPLATNIEYRPAAPLSTSSLGLDAGMVNVLPFKEGQDFVGETRAAIHALSHFIAGADEIIRGIYVWEKSPGLVYYFACVKDAIYTSTDASSVPFSIQNNWSALGNTTPVRFTEFIDDVNVKKLIVVDGTSAFVFTDNTSGTIISDADFPSPHIPFPVFMDGYLFIAKKGTGDIYNCDLNDPMTWTPGNFISTEIYPDDVQALVKVNNQIAAVGTKSTEFFYDAGNAIGSPLARVEGSALPIGTMLPNSIAENNNTFTMVASRNDGAAILATVENQRMQEMDPNVVIGILNRELQLGTATRDSVRAYYFRQKSELFYGLSFGLASKRTFVYSFEHKMWVEFTYTPTGDQAYPVHFTSTANSTDLRSYVAGYTPAGSYFGLMIEGYMATGDDNIDSVMPIYQEIRTNNIDFGTMNLKQMHRCAIDVDVQVLPPDSTGAIINVTWTDNDYSTSTTQPLHILNATDTARGVLGYAPFVTQLGTFRRRQFKFTSNTGRSLRWRSYEMDINKGNK